MKCLPEIKCDQAIEAQLQQYAAIQNEGEMPLTQAKNDSEQASAKKRISVPLPLIPGHFSRHSWG
jgi:hypothetical protein